MEHSIRNNIDKINCDINFLSENRKTNACDDRTLFYYLLNYENYPEAIKLAYDKINSFLESAENDSVYKELLSVNLISDTLIQDVSTLCDLKNNDNAVLDKDSGGYSDEVIHQLLLQLAPGAILDGYCLNEVSNAALSHTPISALLHQIQILKSEDNHHGRNFISMADSLGLHIPPVESYSFAYNKQILISSLRLPLYHVCLSFFPSSYLPEILGCILYCSLNAMPKVFFELEHEVKLRHGSTSYFNLFKYSENDSSHSTYVNNIITAIKSYLNQYSEYTAIKKRILKGFSISLNLNKNWIHDVYHHLTENWLNPNYQMYELIRNKAYFAQKYHGRIKLAKCPFDQLIKDDPKKFINALGNSSFIYPGYPEKSHLLTKTIAYGGKMFGIFNRAEIKTISNWIRNIKNDNQLEIDTYNEQQYYDSFNKTYTQPHKNINYQKATIREIYYYLINIEMFPSIRPFAKKFVLQWLEFSRSGIYKDDRAIPFINYDRKELRSWFYKKHQDQVNSYADNNAEVFPSQTREEVINDAVQICPMILIDGAWLQKWGLPHKNHSEIGKRLFRIYSDEIGNGEIKMNHPNVYRSLMLEMGIKLPELNSIQFAQWHGFEDRAFQVPVFWLSISQYPQRFLPETLGLNLAMEMSGVGSVYRTSHDLLKYYGYSTIFVDLHNSIDNFSSGHSAMALEAIEIYMEDIIIANNNDAGAIRQHWQRIWTGYRALIPPKTNLITKVRLKTKQALSQFIKR